MPPDDESHDWALHWLVSNIENRELLCQPVEHMQVRKRDA